MNLINHISLNLKRYARLCVTGFAMGTADLIPGVSGGTIAFLSGIYEELLESIKIVSGKFIKLMLQMKFREAFSVVPFKFLVPLMLGLFSAIFILSNLISYLLSSYATFVWAFFFGLVLASVWVVLKRVVIWDLSDKILFPLATVVTFFIVGLIPFETPNTPIFIFLSGAIAICAMILPGISGSFILLLLGKYQQILAAVNNKDFFTLAIFMVGCVVGLALFARVLTWLFKHHHDISIVILAGIMLGSIRKIWPWQEVVSFRINSHGEQVPLIVKNILPSSFDMAFLFTIVLIFIGAAIILYLDRLQLTKEHTTDINGNYKSDHAKALKNQ